MTTQLFYTDTLASLTISGYVVRKMSTSRGSGVVTKTDNSSATSPVQVTDNGSTPLCFAFRVNAVTTTTGTYSFNHWGSESSAMANFGAIAQDVAVGHGAAQWFNNSGSALGVLCVGGTTSTEYGTSAAAKTFSDGGTARTMSDGDWIVIFPAHGAVGSPASGFTLNFSYNGTTGAANGDSFVTLPDNVTEFVAAARVPRTNPYPQLLAH